MEKVFHRTAPNLLILTLCMIVILISCNQRKDKKTIEKAADSTVKTPLDTNKINFVITDSGIIKGFRFQTLKFNNGKSYSHLTPDAQSIEDFNTHQYRISADNLETLLTSNIANHEVKQIVMDFRVSAEGIFQLFMVGKNGDGDPVTDIYFPEEINNITLDNVAVFDSRLTRGNLRSLIKGTTSIGTIDLPLADLILTPIKNGTKNVTFRVTNQTEAARGTQYSNPIPPARPGCEPDCDD